MDDAHGVGESEGIGGFLHNPSHFFRGQASSPTETGGERFAIHVPHDEIHQTPVIADREDGNDVWVGEPGGGLGLAEKPGPNLITERQIWREKLDGDSAVQLQIACAVDHPHAAPPDLTLDRVGVLEHLGQSVAEGAVASLVHWHQVSAGHRLVSV